MMYLLAIVLPPLAVLMAGRIGAAFLNLLLTCLLWVPGIVHAFAVVADHKADQRARRLERAVRRRR